MHTIGLYLFSIVRATLTPAIPRASSGGALRSASRGQEKKQEVETYRSSWFSVLWLLLFVQFPLLSYASSPSLLTKTACTKKRLIVWHLSMFVTGWTSACHPVLFPPDLFCLSICSQALGRGTPDCCVGWTGGQEVGISLAVYENMTRLWEQLPGGEPQSWGQQAWEQGHEMEASRLDILTRSLNQENFAQLWFFCDFVVKYLPILRQEMHILKPSVKNVLSCLYCSILC